MSTSPDKAKAEKKAKPNQRQRRRRWEHKAANGDEPRLNTEDTAAPDKNHQFGMFRSGAYRKAASKAKDARKDECSCTHCGIDGCESDNDSGIISDDDSAHSICEPPPVPQPTWTRTVAEEKHEDSEMRQR